MKISAKKEVSWRNENGVSTKMANNRKWRNEICLVSVSIMKRYQWHGNHVIMASHRKAINIASMKAWQLSAGSAGALA
jgi:hypothetical protein